MECRCSNRLQSPIIIIILLLILYAPRPFLKSLRLIMRIRQFHDIEFLKPIIIFHYAHAKGALPMSMS